MFFTEQNNIAAGTEFLLDLRTGRPLTESHYIRCCINTTELLMIFFISPFIVPPVLLQTVSTLRSLLIFRHSASCILGQAFHYSPENAFYIFNQQIYFII